MITHGPRGMPVHPYLDLAIATNFAYLRPGNWLPLLVEFASHVNRAQFTTLGWLDKGLKNDVLVPDLFKVSPHPAFDAPQFNFCVLLVRKCRAGAVVQDASWNNTILQADMGPPCESLDVGAFSFPDEPVDVEVEWMERVAVAVIDEGIGFAHPRFRNHPAGGTRVEYAWRQDSSIVRKKAQIDYAVTAAAAVGKVEDDVYRSIGGLVMAIEGFKPLARRHAHGTHVSDLASGYGPGAGPPRPLPLLLVDMPEAAVGDPAGSTLTPHAFYGLMFVWFCAMSMRRPGELLPVVANISYGPHDGPHDGSSWFEQCVDLLTDLTRLTHTPMRVVLAAGNYRQSRTHAHVDLPPGATRRLAWRVQPCGMTPSFMEIWFPTGSNVTVTLTPPVGAPYVNPPWVSFVSGAPRDCFLLFIPPTADDPWATPMWPLAPSGIWSVDVTNGATAGSVCFDAWIRRSDTPGGRRAKGRQSYFDDPAYKRHEANGRPKEFDEQPPVSYVRRRGTLSGIATGYTTSVVGAYRRDPNPLDQMPATYSSEGAEFRIPCRAITPDWLTPGEDACSFTGVLGAGTRGASRVAMNGTSAAAPQLTRFFAENWDGGLALPVPVPVPPPPPADVYQVSPRVPPADWQLVAGNGLIRLHPPPPFGCVWKNNRP